MFRGSVLALALVFSGPTVWAALGPQTVGVQTALIRFLICVPIAAGLLALVRVAMRPAARREPKPRTPGG